MKKLSYTRIAQLAVIFGIILASQLSMAKMTSLSDEELGEVTAQAGISLSIDHLNLDTHIDTLYYGDKDGLGEGTGTTAGYLSLNDVEIVGSVAFGNPLSVDVATEVDAAGNTEITKINMTMGDMTLDIERLTIDSITLGSAPGKGNSLGSFGILGLHAEMTGNVSITAH
jgi:hypothetical protein